MHQHQRHRQAQPQARHAADQRPGRTLACDDRQYLPAGESQVRQQAKLFAPRQHLRAEAGRHPKQANRDRHALQPVSHRKAAVKNSQGDGAYLAGGGKLQQAARTGHLVCRGPHSLLYLRAGRIGFQPQRQVVDAGVTCQAFKVSFADDDSTKLAGIVAPDTCHIKFLLILICYGFRSCWSFYLLAQGLD